MSFRSSASGGRFLLPVLAVVSLALAACGGEARPASPIPTTTVDLPKSYRFEPAAIVVPVGATVTWTNHDNFTHTVTLEDQAPLTMAPGESVSYTFTAPGLYRYICSLHPKDMKGTVLVTGS